MPRPKVLLVLAFALATTFALAVLNVILKQPKIAGTYQCHPLEIGLGGPLLSIQAVTISAAAVSGAPGGDYHVTARQQGADYSSSSDESGQLQETGQEMDGGNVVYLRFKGGPLDGTWGSWMKAATTYEASRSDTMFIEDVLQCSRAR